MAPGKRASMREGPLAALFRRTDEDADEQPAAPVPEAPAAAPTGPEPEAVVTGSAPQSGAPAEAQALEAAIPPIVAPPEVPHPSLAADLEMIDPPSAEPRIPTPQERLRHAFSSELELPQDVLEPVVPIQTRRLTPEPPQDAFARPDAHRSAPFGQARPLGQPVIRVVGVGGGGVNAVNRMVEAEVEGVEFVADQHRSAVAAAVDRRRHPAHRRRRSRGAWARARTRSSVAVPRWRSTTVIKALLKGSDMVFITAGAGGGTGTGAAPVVARIAHEIGALTVGIVTKPFGFEGTRRSEQAEVGIQALTRGGRHPHRRTEQPAAVRAGQADVDGRGLPRRRRRPAPGRAGRLGSRDAPGAHQPRLRRRADDHGRRGQRAAGDRHGHRREARDRRRRGGGRIASAGDEHGRRAVDPALDHRRHETCRCGRSTRRPRRWPRPRIPMRTSSSARWWTRSSATRSG